MDKNNRSVLVKNRAIVFLFYIFATLTLSHFFVPPAGLKDIFKDNPIRLMKHFMCAFEG